MAKNYLLIYSEQLARPITTDQFEIGDWKFIKCVYEVK